MSKIENKYKLYTMGKEGQKVTKKIDKILEKAVSDINKSIIMAIDLINRLETAKLGVGDTSTDEAIGLKFKNKLEDLIDSYSISRYFYHLLHFGKD